MGKIAKPKKVKLIIGAFTKRVELFQKVERALSKKFGEIDFESKKLFFAETDYYEREISNAFIGINARDKKRF